jgi:hypothetical protein
MAGERKQPITAFPVAKGIFMEETERGAKRRWRDGENVRWFEGLPEKIGGFTEHELTDEEGNPVTYIGRARSYIEWSSLEGQQWAAFGTHCKLYLIDVANGVLYDITPVRRTATIIDGFATEAGSQRVTVTDPSHDAEVGDHVRFSGATAVGGITIDGEYRIVEVIDVDTYVIEHATAATSADFGGGAVVASYDISCGLETDGTLDGYGTGAFGEGDYGTPREDSTFGGHARVWSLDNWGEELLASPSGETLYVWRPSLGPSSRATRVSGAPDNIEFMLVGPDNRHVIAFGTNLAATGQHDRMFVRWCKGDDYEDWLATSENDAGSKRLDNGSRLITAVKTRDGILIWSDKALYFLSPVGGQQVYAIRQVSGRTMQIVSKRAATDVDGIVYWMGEDDFYVWDGVLRKLPCEVAEFVFGGRGIPGINRIAQSKVQCTYMKEFGEIWWDFPSAESLENDRVAIFNIEEGCWYKSSTLARETRGDRSAVLGHPLGFSNGHAWKHEDGVDADGEPLPWFLESYEAEAAEGEYEILINSWIPDFKRLVGECEVSVYGREYPHAARQVFFTTTMDASTQHIDERASARQFGIRIGAHRLGSDFRMGEWRVQAGPNGSR